MPTRATDINTPLHRQIITIDTAFHDSALPPHAEYQSGLLRPGRDNTTSEHPIKVVGDTLGQNGKRLLYVSDFHTDANGKSKASVRGWIPAQHVLVVKS